ncbi:Barstar (barnase inhibitor) [Planctopirus ephydatiae]|uniref:Barstar (Barnase inhibitor) n=1 Tax=Planctopirus ephydatiae TaxID=2528019 RepID=A0A518GU52_9PLAN|nr:barstar family protein [Planctopirus ephydatiae]QDV32124.1 Barstar (barnase inhibitor) [Planctopirus ephydatiae]
MSSANLPYARYFEPLSPAQLAAGVFEVTIPARISSKQTLLEIYSQQLRCPWFGHNWDALADALNDLSWLHDRPVVIRHEDLPFGPGRRSRNVYLDVLAEAVSRWQVDDPGRLRVLFPEADLAGLYGLTPRSDQSQ